jgi:hypothetical protein
VTFQSAAYAVDGNAESGNFLRLMLQSATAGSQGVVGALDCIVTATTPTPTAGIVIASGACVVLGAETPYQGSYYGYNVGNDTSLTIAATTGTIRSDMVVLRAEDPTWSGSPWGNPASGQILFPRVISNVSAGATTVPGGYSAIPLARIDMPATSAVVQQSYIHDLRSVNQPLRLLQVLGAGGPGAAQNWTVGTGGVIWPSGASWSVAIPSWATIMQMNWEINDALWQSGWARGYLNPFFGTLVGSPNLVMPQTLVSIPTASGPYRHSIAGGFNVAIPVALRGTTQTLQFKQVTDGTQTGILSVDEGSSYAIVYEFQQLAALA